MGAKIKCVYIFVQCVRKHHSDENTNKWCNVLGKIQSKNMNSDIDIACVCLCVPWWTDELFTVFSCLSPSACWDGFSALIRNKQELTVIVQINTVTIMMIFILPLENVSLLLCCQGLHILHLTPPPPGIPNVSVYARFYELALEKNNSAAAEVNPVCPKEDTQLRLFPVNCLDAENQSAGWFSVSTWHWASAKNFQSGSPWCCSRSRF